MPHSMIWYQLQDTNMESNNTDGGVSISDTSISKTSINGTSISCISINDTSINDTSINGGSIQPNSLSIPKYFPLKVLSTTVYDRKKTKSTEVHKTTFGFAKMSELTDFTPPPALRGLAYGDGFFTTIGIYKGHPLWQSYHQSRLKDHCQALNMTLNSNLDKQLCQFIHERARETVDGIIKIIVSRQAQSLRGYAYDSKPSNNNCIIWVGVIKSQPLANQKADLFTSPAKLSLSASYTNINESQHFKQSEPSFKSNQIERVSEDFVLQQPSITATCLNSRLASLPEPIAGLKTLNRLDSVMIAGELERLKLQNPNLAEGLVRDLSGNWVEGVMSNIFYQLDPSTHPEQTSDFQWYTPPITSSGVRGVMRQVIIDKMAATGQPVVQRVLQDSDLTHIKALFFCNAVRGVIPVRELVVESQVIELTLEPFITISVSM